MPDQTPLGIAFEEAFRGLHRERLHLASDPDTLRDVAMMVLQTIRTDQLVASLDRISRPPARVHDDDDRCLRGPAVLLHQPGAPADPNGYCWVEAEGEPPYDGITEPLYRIAGPGIPWDDDWTAFLGPPPERT